MSNWTMNDIPDLQGRVVLVTGANSSLGLETTRALAAHGAHVIMACRHPEKAREAETNIKQTVPGASLGPTSPARVGSRATLTIAREPTPTPLW